MIYFIQPVGGGPIKIGHSKDVSTRIKQLESHYRTKLALLGTMPGSQKREREIHLQFSHLRFGDSEQFKPAAELLDFIGKPLFVSPNPDTVAAIDPPVVSLGIRCTEAWKQWLQDYANSRRKVMADLIDEAIEEHAEKRGYKPLPPKR